MKDCDQKRVLVTGAAGFIGSHVSRRLLERGDEVIGLDNLNPYYDPRLKEDRLRHLCKDFTGFEFLKEDIADRQVMERVFEKCSLTHVVHMAAQVGVRYSPINPYAFVDANLVGFLNLLEGCRQVRPKHLVFASSSSVYGANARLPFSVHDNVDHPLSLYGATKKANELMAHSYASLFSLPVTGLRFFTVYGPWGRPDMAMFKFVKAILEGTPISVYNEGDMIRDFTYIDDVVEGVIRVLDRPALPNAEWDRQSPEPSSSFAPYRIYNIGNSKPVGLMDFIRATEEVLGQKAKIRNLPMQPGDVQSTYADVSELERDFGYHPSTEVKQGIARFVDWYRQYYSLECSTEAPPVASALRE